jgi:hypothetical protein
MTIQSIYWLNLLAGIIGAVWHVLSSSGTQYGLVIASVSLIIAGVGFTLTRLSANKSVNISV